MKEDCSRGLIVLVVLAFCAYASAQYGISYQGCTKLDHFITVPNVYRSKHRMTPKHENRAKQRNTNIITFCCINTVVLRAKSNASKLLLVV